MDIGLGLGWIPVIFGMLFVWSVLYNILVGRAEEKGYADQMQWLLVCIGVGAVILHVAVLDPAAAELFLFAFIVAGTPMVLGSCWRMVRRRRAYEERRRDERA